MRQRVHIITLGTDDLSRGAAFYDALGWTRVTDTPSELAIFDLGGLVLGLYDRASMTADIGHDVPCGSGAMTLSHNCGSEAEVDQALSDATAAGATLLRPARKADWGGYNGYFADPDGHVWEVAFNPFIPNRADGTFAWAPPEDERG